MKRVIIFYILLISMTASLSAQLKIGYILSERIRGEYEEFKEAESQLQLEYRKVQFEFDQRVKKLDTYCQKEFVENTKNLKKQNLSYSLNIGRYNLSLTKGLKNLIV